MNEVSIEVAHKFCPQCGTRSKTIGKVPFRCSECGFANFFGPVAAVGALVVNDKNQLLLVRRARDPAKGRWGLPGGFVDRFETIEDAIVREVHEETSLQLSTKTLLMSHPNGYRYGGIVVAVIDIFFVCQARQSDAIRLQKNELSEFRWVERDSSLFNEMAFESNRIAIDQWIDGERQASRS